MMRNWVRVAGLAALLVASPAVAQSQGQPQPGPTPTTDSLTYIVRRGDTLIDLATDYLNRPADYHRVQRDNRVADPRRLAIGRTLIIPFSLLRADRDYARVASFRGAVTLSQGGAAGLPAPGQTVSEGTVLSTGPNAFVRLALSDGSHIVIPSNSRVRLSRLRRYALNGAVDHAMTVESGRAESSVTPRRRPGGFVVSTPVSVSAVRGTEFRVTFNDDTDRAATEVIEGVVNVASGDGSDETVAHASEGVAITVDALHLAPLLAAPELTDPAQVHSERDVRLLVAALPGAQRYRGRLATDAGMIEAFAETDSAPGDNALAFLDLDDGAYFVRLTALSDNEIEGRAATYSFIRARNGVGGLTSILVPGDRFRLYRFRWEAEGGGAATFRFQLSRQGQDGAPEGPPLIDQPGLTDQAFTLTDLPPGVYTWRVQGARDRFGHLLQTWSEPQQLRIGR